MKTTAPLHPFLIKILKVLICTKNLYSKANMAVYKWCNQRNCIRLLSDTIRAPQSLVLLHSTWYLCCPCGSHSGPEAICTSRVGPEGGLPLGLHPRRALIFYLQTPAQRNLTEVHLIPPGTRWCWDRRQLRVRSCIIQDLWNKELCLLALAVLKCMFCLTVPKITAMECLEAMAAGLYSELFTLVISLVNR